MAFYQGRIPKKADHQPGNSKPQQSLSADSLLLTALWGKESNTNRFIATQDPTTLAFHTYPVANALVANSRISEYTAQGLNVFHACSGYTTTERRTKENVESIKSFWFDMDCGKEKAAAGKGYASQADAQNALHKFCVDSGLPPPNFVINSGNGIHAYWSLDLAIGLKRWQEIADKLKALTVALGLKVDPSRTADSASLMRTPGSMNHKGKTPLPVTTIHSDETDIPVQLMFDAINNAFEKHCGKASVSMPAATAIANTFPVASMQPEFDRLKSALTVLDPDCDDFTWKFHRLAPLARAARENPELHDQFYSLARDWSSGRLREEPCDAWSTPGNTNGRTGEQVFDSVWERLLNYKGEKKSSVGTIYFAAKASGWVNQSNCFSVSSSSALAARNAEKFEVIDASLQKMSPLRTVQQQYCLVNMEGRLWVLDLRTHNAISSEGSARKLVVSNLTDGTLLVRRALRGLGVDGDGSFRLSNEFLNNPQTICYDGVEFNPIGSTGNYLNLWVGPTLLPTVGGWTLIRSFLLEIICNDDQVAFDFLLNFLAHALQRPGEKPGIMVIMIGGQGIGKGTLGKILRLIWSATYWQIHKIDQVTGNFNAVLERAFIVFLDEAMFVGDRKASDALKSLVTEPIIQINEKYQPARQTRSYHRFFAATNAEHFKNTERDDRRDFVLKVSEAKKDDHAYWSALNSEIEDGGAAAMMHDLLAIDLSGFNVRAKPSTAALLEQKLLSLGPVERWWHNALSQGNVEGLDDWPDFIPTTGLIAAVMDFSGGKVFRKPSPIEVVKTMKQICPSATNKQQQDSLSRHRGLALPILEQARREFEQYIGGAICWESDGAS